MSQERRLNPIMKLGIFLLLAANLFVLNADYPTPVGFLIFPYVIGAVITFIGIVHQLTGFRFDISPLDPQRTMLFCSAGLLSGGIYFVLR
jgi:hypothetical protein